MPAFDWRRKPARTSFECASSDTEAAIPPLGNHALERRATVGGIISHAILFRPRDFVGAFKKISLADLCTEQGNMAPRPSKPFFPVSLCFLSTQERCRPRTPQLGYLLEVLRTEYYSVRVLG